MEEPVRLVRQFWKRPGDLAPVAKASSIIDAAIEPRQVDPEAAVVALRLVAEEQDCAEPYSTIGANEADLLPAGVDRLGRRFQ
jgi:hypothetical protein